MLFYKLLINFKEIIDMRVIFMGTPEFAVASLRALYENNCEIVAVITSPDKPAGRGQKLSMSAVKVFAQQKNLNILQPTNLKDETFLATLKQLDADLQIIVAFRMLPHAVWSMHKYGTFNLHGSLLPQYRGAAPINWAIINGETTTGLTTFFLEEKIDTGNIIFQEEIPIDFEDTADSLHDKLMNAGAELVIKTVNAIQSANYQRLPQQHLIADYMTLKNAPKIFKEHCKISWQQNSLPIYNFIRGMSSEPAAWTEIKDIKNNTVTSLKIFETEIVLVSEPKPAATFETDAKNYLRIYTNDGALDIKNLQLAGKKRMNVKDFLRGHSFENKTFLI